MQSLIFPLFPSHTRQGLYLKFFPMWSQYWKSYNFCLCLPLIEEGNISAVKILWKNVLVQEWHISLYSLNRTKHRASQNQGLWGKILLCTWANNSNYLLKNHDWYNSVLGVFIWMGTSFYAQPFFIIKDLTLC